MKDRIKYLRKSLNMNQTEFGKAIGVAQTTVAGYETGSRVPMDSVIRLICSTFDVREQWLRTGEEPMEQQRTKEQMVAEMVGSVLADKPESFRKRLISVLSTLDDSDWATLEKLADELFNINRKTDP